MYIRVTRPVVRAIRSMGGVRFRPFICMYGMAKTKAPQATDIGSTVTLNDGVQMPLFGLGTYHITDEGPDKGLAVMKAALKYGYRLLDTAVSYG